METKGMMNNKMIIATIDKEGGQKIPARDVIIGDWAPLVQDWVGYYSSNQKINF